MRVNGKRITLAAYDDSKIYHKVWPNSFVPSVKYSLCRRLAADVSCLDTGQRAKSKRRKCRLCFRLTKRKE